MNINRENSFISKLEAEFCNVDTFVMKSKKTKQTETQIRSCNKLFFNWLQEKEVTKEMFYELPKDKQTKVCLLWLNYLYEKGRKLNTLRIYAHILTYKLDFNVNGDKIKEYINAIGKAKKHYVKRAKPITTPKLKEVIKSLNKELKKAQRKKDTKKIEHLTKYKALFLIMFYGAFRVSEITKLELSDVTEPKEGTYKIEVHKSKTSKIEPIDKYISKFSKRQGSICPYRALRKWLNLHNGKTNKLFYATNQKQISTTTIQKYVKKFFGNEYQTHSFRRGFVSEAGSRGFDVLEIAFVTGHKSLDTLKTYYSPSLSDIADKMQKLSKNKK